MKNTTQVRADRVGKFLVLEGPDGSGKTTLAKKVANALGDLGLNHLSRRQVSEENLFIGTMMSHLAEMLWNGGDSTDLPDYFWAYVQGAWFTAHANNLIRPALSKGSVIVDGWYFKLVSNLQSQGWSAEELDKFFARIQNPDHVILLSVDPFILWGRRGESFRPTELGMHRKYSTLSKESFIDYQQGSLDNFKKMAEIMSWPVIEVAGGETEDDTTTRIVQLIIERNMLCG